MPPPAPPAGMRDISPTVYLQRAYITNHLEQLFRRYGYQPLATPAMERLSTLLGKYGADGEQLLFKVLDSGNFLKGAEEGWLQEPPNRLAAKIAKKGLRYDLTVPLARYVAQHYHEILFPFKRYQIAAVWRADRPQKGRYREFYQCDLDVVGASSLFHDGEHLALVCEALTGLGIRDFTIQLNHRSLLTALAHSIGWQARQERLFLLLDKLDKVGKEGVVSLLLKEGLSSEALNKASWIFEPPPGGFRIEALLKQLGRFPGGAEGGKALQEVLRYAASFQVDPHRIALVPTLARGLSYYTGAVFEVVLGSGGGSIAAGGRYEGLTDSFGLPSMAGVGFSFGLDRLYEAMEDRKLFPPKLKAVADILLIPMDRSLEGVAIPHLKALRPAGFSVEFYPAGKERLGRLLSYASKRSIPWVVVLGAEEVQEGVLTLKSLGSGQQWRVSCSEVATIVRGHPI